MTTVNACVCAVKHNALSGHTFLTHTLLSMSAAKPPIPHPHVNPNPDPCTPPCAGMGPQHGSKLQAQPSGGAPYTVSFPPSLENSFSAGQEGWGSDGGAPRLQRRGAPLADDTNTFTVGHT